MPNEEIQKLKNYLFELGAFLSKVERMQSEMNVTVNDDFNRYLDDPERPLSFPSAVSKLDILPEGEEIMQKLKYGQGTIRKKVRKNKNGKLTCFYEGRYYDEFGNQKSVYASTQMEILKKIKKFTVVKKEKRKVYSVEDFMTLWFETFKKKTLKPSSIHSYTYLMKVHFFPKMGKRKLNEIRGEELQRFFNQIETNNVRKKLFVLLNACYKKALALKIVNTNPCDVVELPRYRQKKRRPFEYFEQAKILTVENKNTQAFFFLCATGLRVGEFLALTKDDFYFDQNFFKVDKSIVHKIPGETKSEASNRIVYYHDDLFNHFDLNNLGTYTYNSLKLALNKILKKYGIEDVSLHCTRHTFATVCHALGINDKMLQTLLGHSTLSMTQDVYTHLLRKGESPIRDYLEKFCTLVSTLI